MTGAAPPGEYALEPATVDGRPVARLRSLVTPATSFGAFSQVITAANYLGRRVRLSADLRASGVQQWAGLWMRVDGHSPDETLGFDNMERRAVTGSTDWQRHEIVLDIDPRARAIIFGALLVGEGELCVAGVAFDEVAADVPVTGVGFTMPTTPQNLDFTERD